MSGKGRMLALGAASTVALILVLSGTVAASGSGYNLSYTRSGTGPNPNVYLTSASSSYSGYGLDINVTFTVAGTVITWSAADDYGYFVWFGGTVAENSTAWVLIGQNNTTAYWYESSGEGGSYGTLAFSGAGTSTVTFSIATAIVGPESTYTLDVFADYSASTGAVYSWLGTDYLGAGSGGSGSGSSGSSSSSTSSSALPAWEIGAIVGVIVVVVAAVLVVLLVVRRRRPPAAAPGMAPTQPPPSYPAPPQPPPRGS